MEPPTLNPAGEIGSFATPVARFAFRPGSSQVAVLVVGRKVIQVVDTESGADVLTLEPGTKGWLQQVVFSPGRGAAPPARGDRPSPSAAEGATAPGQGGARASGGWAPARSRTAPSAGAAGPIPFRIPDVYL